MTDSYFIENDLYKQLTGLDKGPLEEIRRSLIRIWKRLPIKMGIDEEVQICLSVKNPT